MYESDIKILELIEHLKSLGRFDFDYEFCDRVGVLKQNLVRIKQGKAHFTAVHIENICKIYKINANWIFGTSNNIYSKKVNTFSTQKKQNKTNFTKLSI
jgi:transcriptional regulator with XRE-family HTH domain